MTFCKIQLHERLWNFQTDLFIFKKLENNGSNKVWSKEALNFKKKNQFEAFDLLNWGVNSEFLFLCTNNSK